MPFVGAVIHLGTDRPQTATPRLGRVRLRRAAREHDRTAVRTRVCGKVVPERGPKLDGRLASKELYSKPGAALKAVRDTSADEVVVDITLEYWRVRPANAPGPNLAEPRQIWSKSSHLWPKPTDAGTSSDYRAIPRDPARSRPRSPSQPNDSPKSARNDNSAEVPGLARSHTWLHAEATSHKSGGDEILKGCPTRTQHRVFAAQRLQAHSEFTRPITSEYILSNCNCRAPVCKFGPKRIDWPI